MIGLVAVACLDGVDFERGDVVEGEGFLDGFWSHLFTRS